jgi:hypothetical protein
MEHLRRALRLSKAMQIAAGESEWERVVALEAERRPVIENALTGKEDSSSSRRNAEQVVREILELDRQVMHQAREARDCAADELANLNRGRRVVKAYRSVAR